ncbi:MAG: methyl-accepting chemotaxis protein [Rickettsiales bacterium]
MHLSISKKIPGLILLASLATAAAGGFAGYFLGGKEIVSLQETLLKDVAKERKAVFDSLFASIGEDLRISSTSPLTTEAIDEFTTSWDELEGSPEYTLQQLYVSGNPNPESEKQKLADANDGSRYSEVHRKYHPAFLKFLSERGYYDVFLINSRGDIVYTAYKEPDFATNILEGKWRDTALGNLFKKLQSATASDALAFENFKPYGPSHDAPASFIGAPVIKDGTFIGAIVFQFPIKKFQEFIQSRTGLGETGELYLISNGFVMHGNDEKYKDGIEWVDEKSAMYPIVHQALKDTKAGEVASWQDVPSYKQDDAVLRIDAAGEFAGTPFVVVVEKDMEEIQHIVKILRNDTLIGNIAAIFVVVMIGYVVSSRSLTNPLMHMIGLMNRLTNSDKSFTVPMQDRKDEIGDLARAVENAKNTALNADRMMEEQQFEAKAKENQQNKITRLIKEFDAKASAAVTTVASAATQLYQTAEVMAQAVTQANSRSAGAASASMQTTGNVQAVASAAEEMSSSVQEISRQVTQSTQAVELAVKSASNADEVAKTLVAASAQIGDVVQLISDIANQINLLALNATIESARAGAAGKGFAVVASEVKNLAQQTGKATEDIAQQVQHVQGVAGEVSKVLDVIRDSISRVNEYSGGIASAIEEQSAVTNEIAKNMQIASSGVEEITANIEGVTSAAQNAEMSTKQVLDASRTLSEQSEMLNKEIRAFLAGIQAA